MRFRLAAACLLAASCGLAAAQMKPATVTFTFDRPGLPVPHYVLEVDETGQGRYEAEEIPSVPAKFAQYSDSSAKPQSRHIERTLTLSRITVQSIFQAAQTLRYFNIVCATKAKNIASTGDKTLYYEGHEGSGSCAYNYSENKGVQALTDTFLDIAFTLDQGRRLEFDHRYDRLGLDQDMTQLVQAVETKRAIEVGMIAPTLSAIADDAAVLQRVREQAARLLEQAKQTMQAQASN